MYTKQSGNKKQNSKSSNYWQNGSDKNNTRGNFKGNDNPTANYGRKRYDSKDESFEGFATTKKTRNATPKKPYSSFNRNTGKVGFSKQLDKSQSTKTTNRKTFYNEFEEDRSYTKSFKPKKELREGQCPLYKKCGGCQLQNMDYEDQLGYKQRLTERLLRRFGKVEKIIGMENPYHYRNKVSAAFANNRFGEPISGVYQSSTHKIVSVDNCMIEDKKADEIIVSIRGLLKSFKIEPYNEYKDTGLLRHVLVKRGFATGEIMVVLVTTSPVFPAKNNFVKALTKLHPEITTIVQNVNDKFTSMILGDNERVMYGKGTIEDKLCGLYFRISSKSFYQINPVQTEVLYNKAIEFADFKGNEKVIDAYCGIGTIGMIASKHVDSVVGVELNKDAVKDAIANARRNSIKNVYFYNADAGDFMVDLANSGEKVDCVMMDPPRAGSDTDFLTSVCALAPNKIVYISCNPETLARDLEFLTANKYQVNKIQPVDMFPHTAHVETVVLMSKVR